MTVGYLNWVTLKFVGRRVYRDHYESDANLRASSAGITTSCRRKLHERSAGRRRRRSICPRTYWEDRARLFASEGAGARGGVLVRHAGVLQPGDRLVPAARAAPLAAGCAQARACSTSAAAWDAGARRLAARGAHRHRSRPEPDDDRRSEAPRGVAEGVARSLPLRRAGPERASMPARTFDLVLGVTVLQHILDPRALRGGGVADGGAPRARWAHGCCWKPRPRGTRNTAIRASSAHGSAASTSSCSGSAGYGCSAVTGVDPAPFKYRLLPHLKRLPRRLAVAATTAASLALAADRRAVRPACRSSFVACRCSCLSREADQGERPCVAVVVSAIAVGVLAVLAIAAGGVWWYQLTRAAPGPSEREVTAIVSNGDDRGPGSLREALFVVASAKEPATISDPDAEDRARETALPPIITARGAEDRSRDPRGCDRSMRRR